MSNEVQFSNWDVPSKKLMKQVAEQISKELGNCKEHVTVDGKEFISSLRVKTNLLRNRKEVKVFADLSREDTESKKPESELLIATLRPSGRDIEIIPKEGYVESIKKIRFSWYFYQTCSKTERKINVTDVSQTIQ